MAKTITEIKLVRGCGIVNLFAESNLCRWQECLQHYSKKMDLQQLQNQCEYEVNTTFDQSCLCLPRGKFHC